MPGLTLEAMENNSPQVAEPGSASCSHTGAANQGQLCAANLQALQHGFTGNASSKSAAGSASFCDGGDAATELDAGVASEFTFSTIICIRCKFDVPWKGTQPYGRNPFARSCPDCSSSYRGRMSIVKKQKTGGGSSAMEQWWKGLSEQEQVDWYRKQRRSVELKSKPREWQAQVSVTDQTQQLVKRGRRRVNVLLTWSAFATRHIAAGHSQSEAEAEWRRMLVDHNIFREEICIGGKMELAIEMYDRTERYHEDEEAEVWSQNRKRRVPKASQLPLLVEEQAILFDSMRPAFLGNPNTPEMQPKLNLALLNIEVAPHKLPTPGSSDIRGPDKDRAQTQDMLRDMMSHEKTEAEQEAEMMEEAQKARQAAVKSGLQSSVRTAKLLAAKQVIAAKAVADGMLAGVKTKFDTLTGDFEVLREGLNSATTLPKHDEMLKDMDKTLEGAKDFYTKVFDSMTKEILKFDDNAMTLDLSKAIKTTIRDHTTQFVSETSPYKTACFLHKTYNQKLTRHNREMTKTTRAAAAVVTDTTQSEWYRSSPLAAAIAGMQVTSSVATSMQGVVDVKAPFAIKVPSLAAAITAMKVGTWYRNQRTFLQSFIQKNKQATSQECPVTVRVINTTLKQNLDDVLAPGILVSTSVPEFSKSELAKTWNKQIGLSVQHVSVGLNAYGTGMAFFCIEGSMKLAAFKVGKFEGDMKQQVSMIRGLTADEFSKQADFSWEFSQADDAAPKGFGELCVVPPGYIFASSSAYCSTITQSYGLTPKDGTAAKTVKSSLDSLFESYPHVNTGTYAEFYKLAFGAP
jgi:hypothetical protein